MTDLNLLSQVPTEEQIELLASNTIDLAKNSFGEKDGQKFLRELSLVQQSTDLSLPKTSAIIFLTSAFGGALGKLIDLLQENERAPDDLLPTVVGSYIKDTVSHLTPILNNVSSNSVYGGAYSCVLGFLVVSQINMLFQRENEFKLLSLMKKNMPAQKTLGIEHNKIRYKNFSQIVRGLTKNNLSKITLKDNFSIAALSSVLAGTAITSLYPVSISLTRLSFAVLTASTFYFGMLRFIPYCNPVPAKVARNNKVKEAICAIKDLFSRG